LKKILLLFALIFSSIIVKAQGDYNFMPFGVGGGASVIRGFTNVAKQNNTLAVFGTFTWYYTPYIPITAELQYGRLQGGSRTTDKSGRAYENNYILFLIHAELQLGQVIDYRDNGFLNVLKNIYFGPGFGYVDNNVHNQRFDFRNPSYGNFPGTDHSINPVFSLRLGYELKFYNEYDEPYLRVDFEYTHNTAYGEGLDGYNDPPAKFKNQYPNQYRQITVGVKYDFGLIRSYTKRIRNLSF
jgi:hypothetical protein